MEPMRNEDDDILLAAISDTHQSIDVLPCRVLCQGYLSILGHEGNAFGGCHNEESVYCASSRHDDVDEQRSPSATA